MGSHDVQAFLEKLISTRSCSSIVDVYDVDKDGKISDFELVDAIMDWLDGKISDLELIELIINWLG